MRVKKCEKNRPKSAEFSISGVFAIANYESDVKKTPGCTWGSVYPISISSSGTSGQALTEIRWNCMSGGFWSHWFRIQRQKIPWLYLGNRTPHINLIFGGFRSTDCRNSLKLFSRRFSESLLSNLTPEKTLVVPGDPYNIVFRIFFVIASKGFFSLQRGSFCSPL